MVVLAAVLCVCVCVLARPRVTLVSRSVASVWSASGLQLHAVKATILTVPGGEINRNGNISSTAAAVTAVFLNNQKWFLRSIDRLAITTIIAASLFTPQFTIAVAANCTFGLSVPSKVLQFIRTVVLVYCRSKIPEPGVYVPPLNVGEFVSLQSPSGSPKSVSKTKD